VGKASGSLRARAARAEAAQRVRSMAVKRDRATQDRRPPSLAHGSAEHVGAPQRLSLRCARPSDPRSRAEQAEAEDCTTMRVGSAGLFQHCALRLQANRAQPIHPGSGGAGKGQATEKRRDCRHTGSERARVHVGVAARIHVADEPRLGPGF